MVVLSTLVLGDDTGGCGSMDEWCKGRRYYHNIIITCNVNTI